MWHQLALQHIHIHSPLKLALNLLCICVRKLENDPLQGTSTLPLDVTVFVLYNDAVLGLLLSLIVECCRCVS